MRRSILDYLRLHGTIMQPLPELAVAGDQIMRKLLGWSQYMAQCMSILDNCLPSIGFAWPEVRQALSGQ
jgi:hypothetical protein